MNEEQEIAELVQRIVGIQPGERITYYTGVNLERCPTKIREVAYEGAQKGYLHVTQRRLGPPVRRHGNATILEEVVDWFAGVGPGFEYIATGATPGSRQRRPEPPKKRRHRRTAPEAVS